MTVHKRRLCTHRGLRLGHLQPGQRHEEVARGGQLAARRRAPPQPLWADQRGVLPVAPQVLPQRPQRGAVLLRPKLRRTSTRGRASAHQTGSNQPPFPLRLVYYESMHRFPVIQRKGIA